MKKIFGRLILIVLLIYGFTGIWYSTQIRDDHFSLSRGAQADSVLFGSLWIFLFVAACILIAVMSKQLNREK